MTERPPLHRSLARRTVGALALLSVPGVLGACHTLGLEAPHADSTFEAPWAERPDRRWVGERFWANRLQDWRLVDGRLQCDEGRPQFGFRTLHLLTHRIVDAGQDGSFVTSVVVHSPSGDRAGSAAGFLVGVGGTHVDHRLSAQVVGAPAEDGGILCAMDGAGRVRLVDFEAPEGGGGLWTIVQNHELDALTELTGAELAGVGFGAAGPRPVRLELVGSRYDGRSTLTFTARDAEDDTVLSSAYLTDPPATVFDGGLALVSHRGPVSETREGKPPGYGFRAWRVAGELVARDDERAFGPILFVHYTVDEGGPRPVVRMTAQAGPLGRRDGQSASLEFADEDGDYTLVASSEYVPESATFHFHVEGGFDPTRSTPFRVVYLPTTREGEIDRARRSVYEGVIGASPSAGKMTIGVLSCQKSFTGGLRWNENGFWFPHADVAEAVAAHEPDFLYFAGDQIYEGDVSPATRQPLADAVLDYLGKWYRHGWAFGELTRRIPTVTVPDDHDVYHGNIWGNGGVRAEAPPGVELNEQDRGGYVMPPAFVNVVHRTQVAHLPPPADGAPIAGGISVYHTVLTFGGGSFAILADRMFKSPPAIVIPGASIRNGWSAYPAWDAVTMGDPPGAELLGPRQEAMLAAWAARPEPNAWFRACFSQTPFANVGTLPAGSRSDAVVPGLTIADRGAYLLGDERSADMDSGGWPKTPRDRAVALLEEAHAFHLTGDQHLGSTLRYGVRDFDDAGWVLSSPAVANTWPRRWFPDPNLRVPGGVSEDAPPYAGRYLDGFGNHMTVHAVANPRRTEREPTRLNDRAPGYGIVRAARRADGGARVTFEVWPRFVDPDAPGAAPYPGWPVTFDLPDLAR